MTKQVKIIVMAITLVLTTVLSTYGGTSNKVRLTTGKSVTVTPEMETLLDRLDSLLVKTDLYVSEKKERIKRIRESYNSAQDTERRYWLASELYDEYSAFDSDSALYYTDRALDYARQMGRKDLIDEMQLNRSYVFSATGLLDEASACLEQMNPDEMSPYLSVKYCDRVLFLSTHRDQYMGVKRETGLYSQMVDSLLQEMRKTIKPDNPQYCWLVGWSSLNDRDKAREAIPIVSGIVDNTDYTTRGNAMDAWVLSKLYEQVGDEQNRLKYLILSAMADVRASNKEIASLEELAEILYNAGDLDRANSYINYSIAYANEYKSRVRTGQLAKLQEQILGSIHARHERQAASNHWYLIGLIVILCVLVCAILYIMRQNRLLRKSRHTLNDANVELSRRVEELSQIREELNTANSKLSDMYEKASETARELAEVNEEKEAYIANVFAICSNYINKLEDFRADVNRLLTTRQFEKAMRLVKSPELSYGEVKELYAVFDEIFLSMYPGFVDDFNSLLRPEDRIELKDSGKLNTELRIYALVRLGMNDSVRIAKFLHCSVQTVYNTRHRTRNKAVIANEDFAKAVKGLGKKN